MAHLYYEFNQTKASIKNRVFKLLIQVLLSAFRDTQKRQEAKEASIPTRLR